MKYRDCFLLFPWLALLTSCASAPVTPNCTPVDQSGQLCLLAPEALPKMQATHIVEIRRKNHDDIFLGQLQINAQTLQLAGSSLFGSSLFTIVYDGDTITSQPPHLDFQPEMLVVMLELSVAEPTELKKRLHNLTLNVTRNNHGETRELFERGHVVVRIEISNAAVAEAQIDIEIPSDDLSVKMTPIPSDGSIP